MSQFSFGTPPRLQSVPAANDDVNFGLVLVVGRSPVNQVVVSKIVERSGLRTVAETPDKALGALDRLSPGTVVIDSAPDDGELDLILESLAARRRSRGRRSPVVVLLSVRDHPASAGPLEPIDAVVSKPFTAETLQPVIDSLLQQRHR